eukprot:11222052-Lingulodinium_polyedra.AAC.1
MALNSSMVQGRLNLDNTLGCVTPDEKQVVRIWANIEHRHTEILELGAVGLHMGTAHICAQHVHGL